MRSLILYALGAVLPALLSAQPVTTFLSTFDAERGSTLAAARDGQLWLGGMKDERVLLVKLSTEGKVLEKHSLNFLGPGLDNDYLVDLFEDSDGMLVGCGNFEYDNGSRGFVFRYNPVNRKMVWGHVVHNGLNDLYGITELGAGGDFVLNGNPYYTGGSAAELLQLSRNTGQLVPGKAKRYTIGQVNQIVQTVYSDGALYTCGASSGPDLNPDGQLRNTLSKIDTATFEPVWTRLSPYPVSGMQRLHGRDLIIDDGAIISTCSGDQTSIDPTLYLPYLQKNDLDGNLLWVRSYDLPQFRGEFIEEVISLPDGYMLYGYDTQSDTSRLFLLKTDKDGNLTSASSIDIGYNDGFPDIPARSKILRLNDALFLTARSANDVGQTEGILAKTDLNGSAGDSCGYFKPVFAGYSVITPFESTPVTPVTSASPATLEGPNIFIGEPELNSKKICGAAGTCPDLPDLKLKLDSVTCENGITRLHYTLCNLGGQVYKGSAFFGVYDKNPFTDTARLVTVLIHTSESLEPGDCEHWSITSIPFPPMAFRMDTFTRLYGMIGIHLNMPIPVSVSDFPFTPNSPECGYLNNLDSIAVPEHVCGTCAEPSTFVKKLGLPQRSELGFGMCASRDGNVYVAGRSGDNPMIAKIKPSGEPLWVRNFPGSSSEAVALAEIIEDTDGNLVLCGTIGTSITNRRAFAMRYDPLGNTVLWYKHFAFYDHEASGILELSPGGNFLLRTHSQRVSGGQLKTWTELWELDRNTGVIVAGSPLTQRFEGGPGVHMESMVKRLNDLYSVGDWQTGTKTQPLFARLSLTDGKPVWAYTVNSDTTTNDAPVLVHKDIVADEEFSIIAGSGQKSPSDPSKGLYLYLEKHAPGGALLWLKQYDLSMQPEDVVALPNAYVVFGKMADNNWGVLKTDKSGNVLEAKILRTAPIPAGSTFYPNRQNQILRIGDQFLMLDYSQNGADNDLILLKTDLYFRLDDNCKLFRPVSVPVRTLPAKLEPVVLSKGLFTMVQADAGVMFQPDTLALTNLCPDCFCADKPDLTYHVDKVYCAAGLGLLADVRVCNIGAVTPAAGFDLSFYDKNPLTEAATPLFSMSGLDMPEPDSCTQYALPVPDTALLQFTRLYTLIGVPPNTPTPVALSGFPFPGGFAECDYANNLDSFSLAVAPPQKPDLGSDRQICTGQSAILDAGSGYASYHWVNGPAAQTYTVAGSGVFEVEVSDACGRILRDTVEVSVQPPLENTVTVLLSPGDTVIIGGQPYTHADTVIQTLVTAAGCDSVVTTILQLIAVDAPCDVKTPSGCFRYELLGTRYDAQGQRRYQVRIINTCASPLLYAWFQLPDGVNAVSPLEGALYSTPGGNAYAVRNPNASPFHSIRYKAFAGNLKNGGSDIFEFTLPQQSAPDYIRVAAKSVDGSGSEAHLNTFHCPVQPYTGNKPADPRDNGELPAGLAVRPNPSNGSLQIDLLSWQGQRVSVQVVNTQGQRVFEGDYLAEDAGLRLDLPAALANGLYYLWVQPPGGTRVATRFVLVR